MLRKREGCRNSTLGFTLLHYRYYYRISSAVLVIHLPTNFAESRGTSPQTTASRFLIICSLFWRTLRIGDVGGFLAGCPNRYLNWFLLQQSTTYSIADVKPLTWSKKVASVFFVRSGRPRRIQLPPRYCVSRKGINISDENGSRKWLSLVHAVEDDFLGSELGHIHADPRS